MPNLGPWTCFLSAVLHVGQELFEASSSAQGAGWLQKPIEVGSSIRSSQGEAPLLAVVTGMGMSGSQRLVCLPISKTWLLPAS